MNTVLPLVFALAGGGSGGGGDSRTVASATFADSPVQVFAANGWTPIIFATEEYLLGDGLTFDAESGQYTATRDGVFLLLGQILVVGNFATPTRMIFVARVNTVEDGRTVSLYETVVPPPQVRISTSILIKLFAGDTVGIYFYNDNTAGSGFSQDDIAAASRFQLVEQ